MPAAQPPAPLLYTCTHDDHLSPWIGTHQHTPTRIELRQVQHAICTQYLPNHWVRCAGSSKLPRKLPCSSATHPASSHFQNTQDTIQNTTCGPNMLRQALSRICALPHQSTSGSNHAQSDNDDSCKRFVDAYFDIVRVFSGTWHGLMMPLLLLA